MRFKCTFQLPALKAWGTGRGGTKFKFLGTKLGTANDSNSKRRNGNAFL